ncbi:MAG: site-2 protease family protein [Clostridia bacterium]|nr:site-2 protease family protein [Clostridia bacterium]
MIFIHELGHYLFARLFHVTIREFAIGMGPKLFTRVSPKTGIAYSLRALPIGGFVSMVGEDEASEDPNAFNRKPVWQRILITIAGASMNVLVGVLVMSFLVMSQDMLPSTTIARFQEVTAAAEEETADGEPSVISTEEAGLRVGDTIIKIGPARVHIANDMVYEVMRRGWEPLDVTVIRDGETIVVPQVQFPVFTESGTLFGNVDFYVLGEEVNPATVLKHSFYRATSTIKMIWESLYDMITGRYGVESVSGPVGVTEALGEAASEGAEDLIYLAVVISMNLGIMNLLPFPALDGGRLLFQLIELVRRKPVRPEIEGMVHFAGLVLLMILFVVITFKDIMSLI